MDGLLIGIIMAAIFYGIILLFILSIPVFSYFSFRKISRKMASPEKTIIGFIFVIINLIILVGTYFFVLKQFFE